MTLFFERVILYFIFFGSKESALHQEGDMQWIIN